MTIGIIIQAHWSSSRLKGKISKNICGKLMLERVIENSLQSVVDYVIVATSKDESNYIVHDIVVTYLKTHPESRNRLKFYMYDGDDRDVLSRYYFCANEYKLNTVIRCTSDCPMLSSDIINACISVHNAYTNDYTSFTSIDGMDTEVMSFKALEEAHNNATEAADREHVTTWIKRESSQKKKRLEDVKLSVDTVDDLDRVRNILNSDKQ